MLATQNPIEQEGTYPLPEAQVDRFMLKLRIGYPSKQEERQIMDRRGERFAARSADAVIAPERDHARAQGRHADLRGREDQGLHPRHRLRDA